VSERPEDVDAAFAAIVADLEREGLGADIQAESERPTESLAHPAKSEETKPAEPAAAEPAQSWRGHDAEWDWSWGADEGHYVPPEPPPLPRLRPVTILALILVVCGVVILVAPGIVGLDPRIGTPISLLTLVCGFGLLFLRIRRTPPETDHDNGAQV
jgi:hypothetical protein